jgi:hypothetical protein
MRASRQSLDSRVFRRILGVDDNRDSGAQALARRLNHRDRDCLHALMIMDESFFIGAYWKQRLGSGEACADRLIRLLSHFDHLGLRGPWVLLGGSARRPARHLGTTVREVAKQFKANRRDIGGEIMPELGRTLGFWNGSEESPCSMQIACGVTAPMIWNSAVLRLPPGMPTIGAANVESVRPLFECMVEVWEPDRATFASVEQMDREGASDATTVLGWLHYDRFARG